MALLVLGVAGAWAGNALLGAGIAGFITGKEIGYLAGSMLGSLIGPGTHTDGPRVSDRTITSSTVGTPMPVIYGTARCPGNVIATSTIREVATTKRYGKGGPKGSTTTYTYNVDLAIDLCEGVVGGIRKIWSDGKLVYDISTSNTSPGSIVASSVHAKGWAFYPGDEAQMPDPTLEAIFGIGNVPAYRGRCYIVFQQLDCPSGRIPQLTFEVVKTSTGSTPSVVYTTVPTTTACKATITADGGLQWDTSTTPTSVWQLGPSWSRGPRPADFSVPPAYSLFAPIPVQGGPYTMRAIFFSSAYTDPMTIYVSAPPNGGEQPILSYTPGDSGNALRPAYAAYDPITGKYAAVAAYTETGVRAQSITIIPSNILTATLGNPGTPMAFYNNVIYTVSHVAGRAQLDQYDGDTGVLIGSILAPVGIDTSAWPLIHADANGVYIGDNNASDATYNRNFWKVDTVAGAWTLLTNTGHFDNTAGAVTTMFANDDYAVVGPCTIGGTFASGAEYRVIPFKAIDATDPTVASIILDQCERAGLTAGQVDVSTLADTIHGYPVQRVSPARDIITPVLQSYFIDAVDVDGKMVFKKRASQAVACTIPFDDLAAVDTGPAGDPFPLTRTQEIELPRTLTVQFLDVNADYQIGAEQAIRQVTTSINDIVEDMAICADGTQMHRVAEVRMYDMWNARNARTAKLTRAYAFLCPGDIAVIEYPRGTFGQWLFMGIKDSGTLLEITAVEANAALYQSSAAGAVTASGQTVDPLPQPTEILVADIPLLRDVDDYPGAYVALAGVASNWPGGSLYVGLDDSHLVQKGEVTAAAPIGNTENALGDWTMNTIDETNTLTVNVGPETLSSTTRNGVVTGTDNVCIVGAPGRWEVLQFIRAVSLGSGRYTLSGFKRGLKGTEAYRSTHTASDSFCLLTVDGLLKPRYQVSDLNVAKNYQAITTGASLSTGVSETDTDTGVCLKPLSPIKVRKAVASDGTISFSWGRRTRYSENWLLGSVPLGESSESYDIELRDAGGNLVGSATGLSSASWTQNFTLLNSPRYSDAMLAMYKYGGSYFGLSNRAGHLGQWEVVKVDAGGTTRQAVSADMGAYFQAFANNGGSSLYVAASDAGTNPGAGYTTGNVFMFNGAAFTPDASGFVQPVHTYTATALGDPFGLAFDGTNVWCSEFITGQLVRLDGATLAKLNAYPVSGGVQALGYAGGFIYAVCNTSSELVQVNATTGAVVWRVATTNKPRDLVVQNGLIFVAGQTGVSVHDATGSVVHSFSVQPTAYYGLLGQGQILQTFQGDVVCLTYTSSASSLQLLTLNGTTGAQKELDTVNSYAVSGSDGATLFMVYTPSGLIGNARTDTYQRVASTIGGTFTVWQNSASVGRGYPATLNV